MNEMAADHVWRHRSTLPPETLSLLTEWDEGRHKPRFVSTRDKLLKYPRLILGTPHTVLDENTCPELAFFVNEAKELRDAIVHAVTARKDEEAQHYKEFAIMTLRYDKVEKIVDCAIVIIETIQQAMQGPRLKWLIRRGTDGFFPDSVFD